MNKMPGYLWAYRQTYSIVFFEQAEATRLENPNFQQKVMQTFGLTLGQKDSTCVIVSPDVGHLSLRYFQLRGFVNGTALATVQVQLGEVILQQWHLTGWRGKTVRCTRRPWGARAKPVTWHDAEVNWRDAAMLLPGIGPRSLRCEARQGCNLDCIWWYR